MATKRRAVGRFLTQLRRTLTCEVSTALERVDALEERERELVAVVWEKDREIANLREENLRLVVELQGAKDFALLREEEAADIVDLLQGFTPRGTS
jgi:hypothetical protein